MNSVISSQLLVIQSIGAVRFMNKAYASVMRGGTLIPIGNNVCAGHLIIISLYNV